MARHYFLARLTTLLVLCFALCFTLACATNSPTTTNARTVKDELNRSIRVPIHPQRIVSLAPSITETIFALGAGDRVVGVTTFCDYPPEAITKEKIGDTVRPNIEKIIALKPDLVIVSTSSQLEQVVANLGALGIPVYVSNPRNLDGVLSSINGIGELIGEQARASELTANLRARIEAVKQITGSESRPRVLFILGTEPLITVGGGTFIDDLIARAGGLSISSDAGGEYPQYSLETAVAKQPEVIFISSGVELPARLKQTPAAEAGRVYRLDDNLVLRPGPRVVDGLEQMAARIRQH